MYMRLSHAALIAALVTLGAACGDHNNAGRPDAAIDASGAIDAIDAPGQDGIGAARAAGDGTGLSLPIREVTVTYLKPQIGSTSSDPAGFTIQATRTGPALFVAIDPATLTPPAAVGDVVSFTITEKRTVAKQARVQALDGYTRSATGTDVGVLAQDLSAATDVVSALDHYDSQLVTVTGTLLEVPSAGGAGFERAAIQTAGLAADPNYQLRAPVALIDAIDMVKTCQFTATRIPMGRFNTQAQLAAFAASDLTLRCPAPIVLSATPTSPTTIVLAFSRHIQPSSLAADGSQFTFNNGLTATAATVSGRTVTLTTATAQTADTLYAATIAKTVTDLQGAAVTPGTAAFAGFGSTSSAGVLLSKHTTLGIPGPIAMTAPSDNYVSVKSEYVVSYSGSRRVPNWVSWELNASYLGSSGRANDFRPDDTFPANEPQASLADYSGSGYDRGHMCPSGDRTLDTTTNSQTFYLTNMVPQAANNNQGPWVGLEDESRTLAVAGKELFIISGGTFSATSKMVGADHVVVPDQTFKVIVVLDAVGQGPAAVTTSTRVIAVLMPNDDALISKTADWHTFRVSVDTIEAMTGYDFLSDVDPAIQAVIEARIDNQ
jgi:endonuclease G, mitochondrial